MNFTLGEQGGAVLLFPVTYKVKHWNSIMVGKCQDTSLYFVLQLVMGEHVY